jgi:dTDP-4-dehydrorhamnose 3,5-epimerase
LTSRAPTAITAAMQIERLSIADVLVLRPPKFEDHRGFLSETFRESWLAGHGVDFRWVQENHSYSAKAGTVRALHFQTKSQAKLVRVARGAIFDVAVDLRKGSPTYGRHVSAVLSAENWTQMYIPGGFAHGVCTLEDETHFTYKTSAYFEPSLEAGLRWDDPAFAIDWPVDRSKAILSERDRLWPDFSAFVSPFTAG